MTYKRGINQGFFADDMPIAEMLERSKEAGFDGFEIKMLDEGEFTPQTSEKEVAKIAEKAAELGIEIPSMARSMAGVTLLDSSPAERKAVTARLETMSKFANILGVKTMLLVPGRVTSSLSYDQAYKDGIAGLKEVAEIADKYNVEFAVENVWNKFLTSPLDMRDFIDEIDQPGVGVYFDVGNVVLTGFPEQWIRILGQRIKKVHFKDFKRNARNTNGFCKLMEGDVDWPAVMKALKEIDYVDDYVTAEVSFGTLKDILDRMDQIIQING